MREEPVVRSALLVARSLGRCIAPVMLALGLSACVTYEATLDRQLFPAAPEAAARSAGAVRIRMTSAQSGLVVTTGGLGGYDENKVRMPAGEIVAAAAQLAFEHEFSSVQVEREGAVQPDTGVASGAPWQVIVVPGAIRFDFRDDFVYVIPLGQLWIERRDVTVRLALEVHVIDEAGATRWSRTYDAGRELWKPLQKPLAARPENSAEGVRRLAHEQAYRLLLRAAYDVREWAEAQRGRERVL